MIIVDDFVKISINSRLRKVIIGFGGFFLMPIYEYKCNDCENDFEQVSASHDRDHVKCPKCHSSNIKRLISKLGYLKHPDQTAHKPSSSKKTP